MRVRGILEPLLGTVVLAAALYFGVLLYKHKGYRNRSLIVYKADFDTVDGLSKGTPVKINGVPVGQVLSVELDKENLSAVVSFGIEQGISLTKDTVAAIVSESLLGGKILTIIPGSEDQMLSPGSTIYSTQSSMNLEGLLQKFLFGHSDSSEKKDTEKEEEKDSKEVPEPKESSESKETKDSEEKEAKELVHKERTSAAPSVDETKATEKKSEEKNPKEEKRP